MCIIPVGKSQFQHSTMQNQQVLQGEMDLFHLSSQTHSSPSLALSRRLSCVNGTSGIPCLIILPGLRCPASGEQWQGSEVQRWKLGSLYFQFFFPARSSLSGWVPEQCPAKQVLLISMSLCLCLSLQVSVTTLPLPHSFKLKSVSFLALPSRTVPYSFHALSKL